MNFEEYIKKPFEDQEFEYKEAYWQSAEKLIDNHYQRVRWIRAGIISGILIAAFIAAYLFVQTNNAISPKTDLAELEVQQNGTSRESSSSNQKSTSSEENITLLHSNSENSATLKSESENSLSEIETGDSKDAASIFNSSNNAQTIKSSSSNAEAGKNFAKSIKAGTSESALTNASHSANNNSELTSEKVDLLNNNSLSGSKNEANYNDVPQAIENNSTPSIPASNDFETATASSTILSNHSTSALDLPFRNIEGSNKLKISSFPLHLDFGSRRPLIALPRASRMYATAEMLMYPSGNSEAFKFLGFNAGIGYQQALGKMAFLDMALSGSFRRGNFAPSIVSTQLNYDFGPRSDAYILRPEALFSLQIPVLLGIESGKHMVSAGVKLGFLIGVRGTSEYANYTHAFESPTGQASYAYDVVDEGWIESSGFKKFALAYALKYQYRMNSRIIIGASLQYLPSDWIANDFGKYYDFTSNEYQNPTGNPAQLIERNWLLGVELRYVLFSKY